MAIEDNTNYTLTGTQVKDLAERIKTAGDTHSVELTQAEYDALTPEEKANGTIYFITDGQGGGGKTYTGGNGITVDNTNDTISVDSTVVPTLNDVYTKTEVDGELATKQGTLIAGTGISIASDGKTISATSNVELNVDTTNDFATIQNQNQGVSFDLSDANSVTMVASDPGTYHNSKTLATKDYVDSHSSGAFVLDTANPCSYNELQNAINAPSVILIKHEGNVYPFVEKWESDEGTKRYVNIASLQRQGVDKGAMYFFFEATIGDFDSPMVYSSNFTQPTGKPYTDSIAGNLANLTTTEKTNLVGAVNEVNGKVGVHFAVGQETWYGTYTDENNVTYQAYTKTIFIPALPATAGITTYPIGVSNMKQIIDIFGTTTDGFKLNAPRQTVSDNITIYQVSKGSQTFSIEVGKDRSSKSAYVTIIYAKNN